MLNTVYNLKNREITVNSRHSNSVYPHLCSQSAMRPCSLKSLKVDRVKRLSLAQFLNPLRSGRGLVATGSWQQQPFQRSCGGCSSSSSSLVLVALHLFLLERKSSLEGQRGEKIDSSCVQHALNERVSLLLCSLESLHCFLSPLSVTLSRHTQRTPGRNKAHESK